MAYFVKTKTHQTIDNKCLWGCFRSFGVYAGFEKRGFYPFLKKGFDSFAELKILIINTIKRECSL